VVITIEDEEERPDDKVQVNVKVKVDCWGRVSAGSTKLKVEDTNELELVGLGNKAEIGDKDTEAREILLSSKLHFARPEDTVDFDITWPDNFSFCEGLRRTPLSLTKDTRGESDPTTVTTAPTRDIRPSIAWVTVIVTSWTLFSNKVSFHADEDRFSDTSTIELDGPLTNKSKTHDGL
jgi:hypothetical protein